MHRDKINLAVVEQDNATGRVSYWQGCDNQSLADRNGISLADYIHAMYGFIRQSKAKHVLLIGCGGGTLATMLAKSGAAVTMLDIDPTSSRPKALPIGPNGTRKKGVAKRQRSDYTVAKVFIFSLPHCPFSTCHHQQWLRLVFFRFR